MESSDFTFLGTQEQRLQRNNNENEALIIRFCRKKHQCFILFTLLITSFCYLLVALLEQSKLITSEEKLTNQTKSLLKLLEISKSVFDNNE